MIEHKLKENERYLRQHCKHEWKYLDDGCMYENPQKYVKNVIFINNNPLFFHHQ